MTQKYPDGTKVIAPGTVIVTSGGEVSDVRKVVSPTLADEPKSALYHIDFSFDKLRLGGSAYAQSHNRVGSDVPSVTSAEYFRDAFNAVQQCVRKGWLLAGHDISAGGLITTLLEMCFANTKGGLKINLNHFTEEDITKILFAENPGVVVQVSTKHEADFKKLMEEEGVGYIYIGVPSKERNIRIRKGENEETLDIDQLRDIWYKSSYLLDRKQSMNGKARERFENYKLQPLDMHFSKNFTGHLSQYKLTADRKNRTGIRAAIIREKGTNGEREMAYSLWLAGFDVKDVMMTDLIAGRETLEDINMIVFCGGFSNSDVLGSAKGWAGAFLYNPKAKEALDRFYARHDTLSLGICNGCQLMAELGVVTPDDREHAPKMVHNDSHKFESCFVGVTIEDSPAVMLQSLKGSKLGIWVAHGEGKFSFPAGRNIKVAVRYNHNDYPGNPNGSPEGIAGVCSPDGRHLAMMPHPERCLRPWNWPWYPRERRHEVDTPWLDMFINAYNWLSKR